MSQAKWVSSIATLLLGIEVLFGILWMVCGFLAISRDPTVLDTVALSGIHFASPIILIIALDAFRRETAQRHAMIIQEYNLRVWVCTFSVILIYSSFFFGRITARPVSIDETINVMLKTLFGGQFVLGCIIALWGVWMFRVLRNGRKASGNQTPAKAGQRMYAQIKRPQKTVSRHQSAM